MHTAHTEGLAPTYEVGAGPSLEKYANNLAVGSERADAARETRWRARGVLWEESTLERVRKCGRVPIDSAGVAVRANGVCVGFAGLATCGSIWACPVCNAKIQAVRRLEVAVALEVAMASGGAAFGAYTVRHNASSDLDVTWRTLSRLWNAVGGDWAVKEQRKRLGWLGYIRAAEVTQGRNGWHPHLHPLHLFDRPVSDADVAALHSVEFGAWLRAATRWGYDTPSIGAQDLHRVTGDNAQAELSDYFAKVTWEMTSTQTKSAWRDGASRTPWELLRAVYVDGDADALDLWHEWEKGSKGKRAITWSRGLRHRLSLGVEASDEDVAGAEIGTRDDEVFVIDDWSPVRARPWLGARLLAAVGPQGDWLAGLDFCARHGIAVRTAP